METLLHYWHTVLCISQSPAQGSLRSCDHKYGKILWILESTAQILVAVTTVLIDVVGNLIITLIYGIYSPPGTWQLVKIFQAPYRCHEIFPEFLGLQSYKII